MIILKKESYENSNAKSLKQILGPEELVVWRKYLVS
jgi:hypothetical protein